jgi:AbrB family looped-hinge helix DNA binding protein
MKTGIIRRIDDLGRIVIPREIRRKMNINEGDPLEICLDGDKLYLEKYIASYEYEKHILGIIERLVTDDDLTDEKAKAIQLLKDVCLILHPTEKGGVQE